MPCTTSSFIGEKIGQKSLYGGYMQGHDQGHKKPNSQVTYKDMTKATKSQIAKLHTRT